MIVLSFFEDEDENVSDDGHDKMYLSESREVFKLFDDFIIDENDDL